MSNLYTRGTINIPYVTGNISIIATATAGIVESISAAFSPTETVYDDWTLDDLKQYLVVTAQYEGGQSGTISNYTLSGTIEEGTCTITVTYVEKTTTFTVTVSHFTNSLVNGTYTTSNDVIGAIVTDTNHVTYGDSVPSYAWTALPLAKPISVHNGDVIALTGTIDTPHGIDRATELSVDNKSTRQQYYFRNNTTQTKSVTASKDYTMNAIYLYAYSNLAGQHFDIVSLKINGEEKF